MLYPRTFIEILKCFAGRSSVAGALGLLLGSDVAAGAQQELTREQVKAKFEAANPVLIADAANVDEMRAEQITAFLRPNRQLTMLLDQTYPF